MENANREYKSNISTFADETPREDVIDDDWTYDVLRQENNGYVVDGSAHWDMRVVSYLFIISTQDTTRSQMLCQRLFSVPKSIFLKE